MRNSILLTAGTAVVAGVLSTVSATPVQAQSASFAGSVTVINPSSTTGTVSAERVVGAGREFDATQNFLVTPTYLSIPNTAGAVGITDLSLGVLNTATAGTSSFTAAAANALTAVVNGTANVAANTEAIAAIIKAGAGVDGLD